MEKILSDANIMTKLEKGLGQMSTALRTFSKVCGLIAEKGRTSPDSQSSSGSVSEKGRTSPDLENPEENPEPDVSWEGQVTDWVLSAKCRWGQDHGFQFGKFVIGKKWRADNLRNHWVYVGPREGLVPSKKDRDTRTNWRPCSEPSIQTLYNKYVEYLEDSKVEIHELRKFHPKEWNAIRASKRRRVDNILNATPLSEREFLKIMKDNHKDFAALRGGKKTLKRK